MSNGTEGADWNRMASMDAELFFHFISYIYEPLFFE